MPVLEDAGFICSLGWLFYRVWQIYQKPVDELIDLLGLDIPPVPHVSLAGITSESILLYWKPTEAQSASLKYVIQVNGIKVGDFGHADTSIQVTGLKPAQYYNIRVIATNAADFSTFGPLIRVRTIPSSLENSTTHYLAKTEFSDATYEDEPASVRASPSHFDSLLPSTPHQSTRDHTTGHYIGRKPTATHNSPPAHQSTELSPDMTVAARADDESKSQEDIERLTERLDSARKDQQEIDKQFRDEDQESQKVLREFTQERDRLRQTLKEREESSSELRKHGNYLDKLNRTTQSKKATQEKVLMQKRAGRERMSEEIDIWDTEILEIGENIDRMLSESASTVAGSSAAVAEVRERIADDQTVIKKIEDEIRLKGAQIKAMENDTDDGDHIDSDERLRAQVEKEAEETWGANTLSTQAQLANLWQMLQQAQAENHRAQDHFGWWNSRRANDPSQFAPSPALDGAFPLSQNRPRRIRQTNSRTNTINIPSGGYTSGHLGVNNVTAISPNFALSSPFFNMSNGMAVSSSTDQIIGQTKNQISTNGGPMSPAANDLLPSNLFRDEDIASQRLSVAVTGHESLGSANSEMLGGQGSSSVDPTGYGPNTPVSATSQTGSIFSSPHESLQNLHVYQSRADSFVDSDGQSIHSTNGSYRPVIAGEVSPLAASRIANLFTTTFNRQRGKSSAHDSPSLGTLKQGESQSFPRNIESEPQDPITSRRRRGSYGNWANPVVGLLNRSISASQTPPDEKGLISTRTGTGRRSRLNMFGTKVESPESAILAEKLTSPQSSSTFPYDRGVKRPSSESHSFGWLLAEDASNRGSPFGAGWSTSSGPWSRGPSRRASLQHGSTSNLSIGSTPLEPEGYQRSLSKQFPEQLPIGTRPRSSQRPTTPKLNPTAPTFKTIFGRGEAKRAFKAEKHAEKASEQVNDKGTELLDMEEVNFSYGESSPADSTSKDAQSVMTSGSLADSRNSLDYSTSGTPSEAVTSSGHKETLMQKISRKSSSSKFNVPWIKEKSGLFSRRAGEPSTPDETNDDMVGETNLRQSADSTNNLPPPPEKEKESRSTLSWPNLRRKSKKNIPSSTLEHTERSSDVEDDEDM